MMTAKWVPIYGDFDCPGRMILSADEHGITIRTRRKALGTTEWPGETIRLCEVLYVIGEPDTAPTAEIMRTIRTALRIYEAVINLNRDTEDGPIPTSGPVKDVLAWLDSIQKESTE